MVGFHHHLPSDPTENMFNNYQLYKLDTKKDSSTVASVKSKISIFLDMRTLDWSNSHERELMLRSLILIGTLDINFPSLQFASLSFPILW